MQRPCGIREYGEFKRNKAGVSAAQKARSPIGQKESCRPEEAGSCRLIVQKSFAFILRPMGSH